MAALPRLSRPAFDEARRLVRAQARIVDGRIGTWCANPDDRDALHDARTSLRRLRVLVRSFQTDLGSLASKRVRRDMRTAFRATSGIRDGDVLAAWLLTLPSSPASRRLLGETDSRVRTRPAAAAERLRDEWHTIKGKLVVPKRKVARPARQRSFGASVSAAIREELHEVDRGLVSLASPQKVSAIHAVRIAAKRLRYLLEALAGRSPDARRPIEWCRVFQDLVGEWRDAMLATRRARGCPPLPGRDQLIDRLTERRRRTRAELRRFAADRGAWVIARRDALTISHRYRVLGSRGQPSAATPRRG